MRKHLHRAGTVAVLAAVPIGISTTPAWAHDHGAPSGVAPFDGSAVFIHCLSLLATAAAVATAWGGGRAGRSRTSVAAVIAAVANIGAIQACGTAVVPSTLLALGALALPWLVTRPRAALALGAVIGAGRVLQAVPDGSPARTLTAAGLLAAMCCVGAISAMLAGRRSAGPVALGPVATGAALVTAGVATAYCVRGEVRLDATVLWFTFGWLSIAYFGLAAVAVTVGPVSRRFQAVTASAALVAGVGLVGVPLPPAPADAGIPMVRQVDAAGQQLPVLVTPQRPGWNLVHIGADDVRVGLDPGRLATTDARPGTTGSWGLVWLPTGRSRLWLTHGGATASLAVDTGQADPGPDVTTPDGPECASASLGALLAGARRPLAACPAQELTAEDADALRAMVSFIAGRGATTISVRSDDSPRSVAARQVVEAAGAAENLRVTDPGDHPLLVVSGWAAAETTLREVAADRLPAQGSYLAPWLLTGPLLAIPSSPLLPLRFDVRDDTPSAYLAELSELFPLEPPTGTGYTTWMRQRGVPAEPLRLYAAGQLFVPGADGHHQSTTWVPHGTVTAVSGQLP
ncbi:hypothetical protein [Micromonospora sp. NPDC092111]|uniref:hypothetical protein n=1 Tax=Micromonospora sp. NPDC092111 TaxID=3364289 RepID=UPI00382E305D